MTDEQAKPLLKVRSISRRHQLAVAMVHIATLMAASDLTGTRSVISVANGHFSKLPMGVARPYVPPALQALSFAAPPKHTTMSHQVGSSIFCKMVVNLCTVATLTSPAVCRKVVTSQRHPPDAAQS